MRSTFSWMWRTCAKLSLQCSGETVLRVSDSAMVSDQSLDLETRLDEASLTTGQ